MAWHVKLHFFGTVEVDADQSVVSRFSIVPDGTLLLEQPETARLEKMHQFAEPQYVFNLPPVYRQAALGIESYTQRRGRLYQGERFPPAHGTIQDASRIERMVGRTMTIQIPDDLARGLEEIAAAQKKTVEQVALERLRALLDTASSPGAVLRTLRQLPHPSSAAVDDLDAAIADARVPVRDQGAFDEWPHA